MPPYDMGQRFEYEQVPKPKNIADVPRYLRELLGGFFYRFGYIFALVWKSSPVTLILMMLLALLRGALPVTSSLISKEILNELYLEIANTDVRATVVQASPIFILLIVLFLYRVFNSVITNLNSVVTRIAGEKVSSQVRVQIMEKAKELDLASFDMPEFYEQLENANREAGNRPVGILSSTFSIMSTVIEFVSFVVVLAAAPNIWWSVFIIVAISVPSAIINFIYRRKNFNYMRRRSKDRRQMNYYSDTMVNKDLVKEVRMFDLSDTFIGKYKEVFSKYFGGMRKLIINESIWHIGIAIVSGIMNLFLYALIAQKVLSGQILIGDYTLYTGAISSIASCVATFISVSANIYEGTLFVDNLIAFMKEKKTVVPRIETPEKVRLGEPHTIEFVHVSFAYPGTDRDVLHDINLKINPCDTVVLVGLNGAGKTTLIKLLTRLYDPTDGYILLDGKDLRDYDVSELYSMFGIIFQDFGKYAFTIGENISFGNIHKPSDEGSIKESAKQSAASDYIEKLPQGYDTPLMRIFEKEGTELSIGQWQKLAIARAFYADSDVLILDEPTASLDPIAEQEIFNQFDALRENKTTIFVSHRLSSATV
ncbi:MAG: ABC transporter ATP-binding protein, partial [Clostridiales bacterium]|nr:ABC transporter ATP-binding protein [Clostridiales bacterium]